MKVRKIVAIMLGLLIVFGAAACKNTGGGTEFKLEISDVSMSVGNTHTISYKVTPVGTQALLSYEITAAEPEGCVRISNGVINADTVGTATIKATAKNVPNADETFTVTKTFSVTVTAPQAEAGQFITNGGFENGFYGWTLTPANPENTFKNETTNNAAHGGVSALNLWSSRSGEDPSDELDLMLTQDMTVAAAGEYLYSLWFKGNIGTITMTVKNGLAEVATETFETYEYTKYAMANHESYINLGLGVTIASAGTYRAELHFKADWTGNWGFADDVSFKLGTVEDLLRPAAEPESEHNFVVDGAISANYLDSWVSAGASSISRATDNGDYISCYGTDFNIYQVIEDLPALDNYNASVMVIGPGAGDYRTPTECYYYIADETGSILYKHDFTLPNWSWTKIEMPEGMTLSGTVRIGVRLTFSVSTWAGYKGFSLWSPGYEYRGTGWTGNEVVLLNAGFEADWVATGWDIVNLNKTGSFIAGTAKHSGTRGLQVWGQIIDKALPVTITQDVSGLNVGDVIRLSVWVSTKKADSATGVKLLAGAQEQDMFDSMTDVTDYQSISREFTLTAADIAGGLVTIGIELTFVNDSTTPWLNIDDFMLEVLR